MLTKRQRQVTRALCEGQMNEPELLKHYRLTPRVFNRWLKSEEFQEELDRLREGYHRETFDIISRFGPIAALKLAELVTTDKPDVARRAALNVIDRCLTRSPSTTVSCDKSAPEALSDEQAQDILEILAEGFNRQGKDEKQERQIT